MKQIMILDGYNILHRVPRWVQLLETSLEQGREQLLGYCRRWMQTRGDIWLFCVVFDGDSDKTGSSQAAGAGIRVFFSRSGQTADDRLLAILDDYGPGFGYAVVSDDRYVRDKARLLGASVVDCLTFAGRLDETPRERVQRGKRRAGSGEDGKALDATAAANITAELRRLWVAS